MGHIQWCNFYCYIFNFTKIKIKIRDVLEKGRELEEGGGIKPPPKKKIIYDVGFVEVGVKTVTKFYFGNIEHLVSNSRLSWHLHHSVPYEYCYVAHYLLSEEVHIHDVSGVFCTHVCRWLVIITLTKFLVDVSYFLRVTTIRIEFAISFVEENIFIFVYSVIP